MPRPSGNEDDDAGELPAPACPIHRGHSGGGKPPHPRCTLCDMMVPRRALNGRHLATAHCTRGEERKRRRLAEAEPEGEIGEGPQGIGGAAGERNDISIPRSICKGRLSQILVRGGGADPKVSGNFYKAVVQAVLLFGAEMWILTPRMERALDRFQHRVAL